MKQKGFAPLVLILVIASITAVGFLYYSRTASPVSDFINKDLKTLAPSPSATINPNQLELYTNDKLGFSVRTFKDMYVISESDSKVEFNGGGGRRINDALLVITKEITPFESMKACSDTTLTAPCVNTYYGQDNKKAEEEIVLDGKKARKFTVWRTVGDLETIVQTIENPLIELRYESIADPIVSTFTFVK